MALDVHAEDVPRVQAHLVGIVGELDSAGLATTAYLHLRLDHHRVAGPFGNRYRFVDVRRSATDGNRNTVLREELLALIFVQVHVWRASPAR